MVQKWRWMTPHRRRSGANLRPERFLHWCAWCAIQPEWWLSCLAHWRTQNRSWIRKYICFVEISALLFSCTVVGWSSACSFRLIFTYFLMICLLLVLFGAFLWPESLSVLSGTCVSGVSWSLSAMHVRPSWLVWLLFGRLLGLIRPIQICLRASMTWLLKRHLEAKQQRPLTQAV